MGVNFFHLHTSLSIRKYLFPLLKLFSVFLGGRADKCNTELHDVVFTLGEKIEDTYIDLLRKWFGLSDRLHIDSWVDLNIVEGYKISLSKEKKRSRKISETFSSSSRATERCSYFQPRFVYFRFGSFSSDRRSLARTKPF